METPAAGHLQIKERGPRREQPSQPRGLVLLISTTIWAKTAGVFSLKKKKKLSIILSLLFLSTKVHSIITILVLCFIKQTASGMA